MAVLVLFLVASLPHMSIIGAVVAGKNAQVVRLCHIRIAGAVSEGVVIGADGHGSAQGFLVSRDCKSGELSTGNLGRVVRAQHAVRGKETKALGFVVILNSPFVHLGTVRGVGGLSDSRGLVHGLAGAGVASVGQHLAGVEVEDLVYGAYLLGAADLGRQERQRPIRQVHAGNQSLGLRLLCGDAGSAVVDTYAVLVGLILVLNRAPTASGGVVNDSVDGVELNKAARICVAAGIEDDGVNGGVAVDDSAAAAVNEDDVLQVGQFPERTAEFHVYHG